MRIAAKKARYAAEFFQDLLPANSARRYTHTLSALQDRLGLLNDLAVADGLLAELESHAPSGDLGYARGYIAATSAAQSQHLRGALDAVAHLKLVH